MLNVLAFSTATALVMLSAWGFSRRLSPCGAVDILLANFVLAVTQMTVTLLIAGLAGHLQPAPVLVLNGAITLLSIVWNRRFPAPPRPEKVGWLAVRAGKALRRDAWVGVLIAAACAEVLWLLYLVLLLPPYGVDALGYHLLMAAGWLQDGRIHQLPFVIWCNVYPGGTELLSAWSMLFLRSDVIAEAVQIPFAVAGAVAVAGLARQARVRRTASVGAGCLYLLTPVVLCESNVALVNVAFGSLFLISLYFVARFRATQALSAVFLAGITAGLQLGTKSTGIAGTAILVVLVCLSSVSPARAATVWRVMARPLLTMLAPMILLGGYWYVRTWVLYGSPFFPIQVTLLGHALFPRTAHAPGVITMDGIITPFLAPELLGRSWWTKIAISWWYDLGWTLPESSCFYPPAPALGGFGVAWIVLEVPALTAMLLWSAAHRSGKTLGILFPPLALFALQPGNCLPHYTIWMAGIGAVAAVWLLERARLRHHQCTLYALLLMLVAFSVWKSLDHVDSGTLAIARSLQPSQRTIQRVFSAKTRLRWLDHVPDGAVVALAMDPSRAVDEAYPMFGPHRTRRVTVIAEEGANRFLQRIVTERVSWVYTTEGTAPDRVMRRLPRRFRFEGAMDGTCVYAVTPVPGREVAAAWPRTKMRGSGIAHRSPTPVP